MAERMNEPIRIQTNSGVRTMNCKTRLTLKRFCKICTMIPELVLSVFNLRRRRRPFRRPPCNLSSHPSDYLAICIVIRPRAALTARQSAGTSPDNDTHILIIFMIHERARYCEVVCLFLGRLNNPKVG